MFLMEPLRQSYANGQLISSSTTIISTSNSIGTDYSIDSPNDNISGGGVAAAAGSGAPGPDPGAQGLAALLVMVAVLAFILAYCLWGAPWCRAFCRRRICPCAGSSLDDDYGYSSAASSPPPPVRLHRATSASILGGRRRMPRSASVGPTGTPTIILLPYGRMLVVDGSVIAQFQTSDGHGLDLVELERGVHAPSTPSIMSSDATSKEGLSPIMPIRGFSPPAYDTLFGSIGANDWNDLPPSYSEISFQLRQLNNAISREFGELIHSSNVPPRAAVITTTPSVNNLASQNGVQIPVSFSANNVDDYCSAISTRLSSDHTSRNTRSEGDGLEATETTQNANVQESRL